MSKSIFGLVFNITTDVDFRGLGGGISAKLATMLTKVITSNDINWMTVNKPSANNFVVGCDVFSFNDNAQATHPLFLKFEYGCAADTNRLKVRLTIGKACDAAGVLSGIIFPATDIFSYTGSSTTPQTNYISYADSALCLALAPSIGNIGFGGALIVERAKDSNNNILGNGLWIAFKIMSATSSPWNNHMIAYDTATSNNYVGGIFPTPILLTNGKSLANGTITPYFPAACLAPNGLYWIPKSMIGGALVDCPEGAIINNLLDSKDYIGMGTLGALSDQRGTTYSGILMLWE